MQNVNRSLVLALLSLFIFACSDEVVVPTPVAEIQNSLAPAGAATATPNSVVPTPLPPLDESALEAESIASPEQQELQQLFINSLGIVPSPDGSMGIEGAYAVEVLAPFEPNSLWAVHTIGIRSFDPLQNHAVAVYTKKDGAWQEITRIELLDSNSNTDDENAVTATEADAALEMAAPDYLGEGSLQQVTVEPERVWLQVEGGVGAHSGIYQLLSFDGTTLKLETNGFSSSPGVGRAEDLNGDGVGEIVLDASDYYVFCYACGVRHPQFMILRWDAQSKSLVNVTLQPLASEAANELQTLNNRLIGEANAGLWQDALQTLATLSNQAGATTDETLQWNLVYVKVNGESAVAQTEAGASAYPLLDEVFAGDYATAADNMRGYEPSSIFSTQSPLIVGTVAEGNQQALSERLLVSSEAALAVYGNDPVAAPVYFLRGWASYLNGDNATAIAAVDQAATLAPDDKLYTDSLAFLRAQ